MSDPLDTVIDEIYQAAFDAAHFRTMFERICNLVNASQGCIIMLGRGSVLAYNFNVNPEAVEAYNTAYFGRDPWYWETVRRQLQLVVVTGQELKPTREFRRTDYFADVIVPADVHDCMSITLEEGGEDNAGLIVHRSKRQPIFGAQEKALLEALVPHLRRMVRLRRQFEHQQVIHAFNTQALDFLSFGVVLLDREGIIRFANCAAESIFSSGDGLGLRQGRMVAWHHPSGTLLGQSIARALGTATGCGGSEVCIQRRSGKHAFALQVLPVTTACDELCLLLPGEARGAVVVITDPERQSRPPTELLRQMFGLTATEAMLAAEVGAGASIREYANGHGISEGTARWHLKNVQQKTRTHRVSELVGIVERLAGKLDRN